MCKNRQEVIQCVEQLKLPLPHDAEGRWCINVIALCNVQILYVLLRSDGSVGKESACSAGDPSSTPGSGISAGEGRGYPLQYSWVSLVVQLVKNLPAVWNCRIPWTIPWGHRVRQTEWLSLLLFYFLPKQSWINTNCWQNAKVLCVQDKVIH